MLGRALCRWLAGTAAGSSLKGKGAPKQNLYEQYQSIKAAHPGFLIMLRVGDFYEMFGEDAERGARLLEVQLTKKRMNKEVVAMSGVPAHGLSRALRKLVNQHTLVCVADQVALGAGEKGIMRREVSRLVTPGTLVEDDLLHPRRNNHLAALAGVPLPHEDPVAIEMDKEVVHDVDGKMFFIEREGQRAYASYRLDDDHGGKSLIIEHTVTPPALRGQGLAAIVVHAALAHALSAGLGFKPQCSYAVHYLTKHPDLAAKLDAARDNLNGNRDNEGHRRDPSMLTTAGMGLAWTDVSTGKQLATTTTWATLARDLVRVAPAELLVEEARVERLLRSNDVLQHTLRNVHITVVKKKPQPEAEHGGSVVVVDDDDNDVVDDDRGAAVDAPTSTMMAGVASTMLEEYVQATQRVSQAALQAPVRVTEDDVLQMDVAAATSLEIVEAFDGARPNSLLGVLDRTATAAGARLLAAHIRAPLMQPAAINARLDVVEWLLAAGRHHITDLRRRLRAFHDMQRSMQRLLLHRGGPRDMAALGLSLADAAALEKQLQRLLPQVNNRTGAIPALITGWLEDLDPRGFQDVHRAIDAAIVDEQPPLFLAQGGFVRHGYSAKLDECRDLHAGRTDRVKTLQDKYREETGAQVTVRATGSHGYVVELSAAAARKAPLPLTSLGGASDDGEGGGGGGASARTEFIPFRSTKTAQRYVTPELMKLNADIRDAEQMALQQEYAIFHDLLTQVKQHSEEIRRAADAVAALDVALSHAVNALKRNYTRPSVNQSTVLDVELGRHPVIEHVMLEAHEGTHAVANSCYLDATSQSNTWLISGANMGGKSTFLRQNAHIVVMAQMGSFVPAARASIGVVDQIFTRIGASDDLARDQSTFMMEMNETARIVAAATPRSLAVVDELGRGTSSAEGLALAQAVLEHLHCEVHCRTLFATHFHELKRVAAMHPGIALRHMRVEESADGGVVFAHRCEEGWTDKSYGLYVASLAGLPDTVVDRARSILSQADP